MDPISQAAVGAALAATLSPPSLRRQAMLIGGLSATAPDLDVLIRSAEDPLLSLTYHRQFTHSLIMTPLLAGLCALLAFYGWGRRRGLTLTHCLLWSLLGYASHGLLDSFTSYGTQLLWPLSEQRFAFNIIAVIDPLFTLPLLAFVIFIVLRPSAIWARALALAWMMVYLSLGAAQHHRVKSIANERALASEYSYSSITAKPSFANLLLWKVVYESETQFYVEAIRPGWSQAKVWPAGYVDKLSVNEQLAWLDKGSQQYKDIERFRQLSSGFIAQDAQQAMRVYDVRYSMLPHSLTPMWGLQLEKEKDPDEHAAYFTDRQNGRQALQQLLAMIRE